jgi:hypothetical protein
MAPQNNSVNKFDLDAMEANDAFTELVEGFGNAPVNPSTVLEGVRMWWESWYMRAGHRRLGRILVGTWKPPAATQVPPDAGDPE